MKPEVTKSAALFLLGRIDQIKAEETARIKARGRYVLDDGELSGEGIYEVHNSTLCYLTGVLKYFAEKK